tara:strand:- start:333 stop:533 length:201 start_codon:yes stop_codon:yes gene_type:complete
MNGEVERVVSCPSCKRGVKWNPREEKFLPFCSRRCSLIDLGAWASEEMVIPGETVNDGDSDPNAET